MVGLDHCVSLNLMVQHDCKRQLARSSKFCVHSNGSQLAHVTDYGVYVIACNGIYIGSRHDYLFVCALPDAVRQKSS